MNVNPHYKEIIDNFVREGKRDVIRDMNSTTIKLITEFNLSHYNKITPNWDDLTIRERTPKGHLLPYVKGYDCLSTKRHVWWENIKKCPSNLANTNIPQIELENEPFEPCMEMLEECLRYPLETPQERFHHLLVFLLHGLGHDGLDEEYNKIPDALLWHFHTNSDAFLLIYKVYDNLEEFAQRKLFLGRDLVADYLNNGNRGMFNKVMFHMANVWHDDPKHLINTSIRKPELRSIGYILGLSNYTVNFTPKIFGIDLSNDRQLIKMINLHLYAPFAVERTPEIKEQLKNKQRKGDK